MKHNAEPEACDLLLELERLDDIIAFADEANYSRIALYLLGNADYGMESEINDIYQVILKIYRKLNKYPEALFVAMKIGDNDIIQEIFESAEDP